jgi:hypothetical protein
MRKATRSALRPDRAPRSVASRREGSARRGKTNACNLVASNLPSNATLHLRSKDIPMFSMPQLEFMRCEASSACAGGYMPNA